MLLIINSTKGIIQHLDISIGIYLQTLSNPLILLAVGQLYTISINTINIYRRYIYYISPIQILFYKVLVDSIASATGPVKLITSNITLYNFMIQGNRMAYIIINLDNRLVRVNLKDRVRLVAGNQFIITISGSTVVARSNNGSVLYVTTSRGQFSPILGKLIEPAKVVAVHPQVNIEEQSA